MLNLVGYISCKSQEMIVHLPRNRKHFPYPTAVPDIVRVDNMNILGITVIHTLTFNHHISAIVAKSARSFYALKTIRTHGLYGNALWVVTRATLVPQLLYASPAWWGYLKADERIRLQSVINPLKPNSSNCDTICYACLTYHFTARTYARAVLGVVILSVRLSVCPSVRLSVTRVDCDKTK